LLIDKGQIFVADDAPQVNWRRLTAPAISEESAKGASPTRVVLTYAPADAKPIHFFLRAASGNDLAGPFSLATDAPPGVHCRFVGRIHWGQDPWLVQLGQGTWQGQPAERVTSVPSAARHTHSSVASLSSPGFVSAPRDPNVFQMAAGAVSDLNSDTVYDPTSDRALVFQGPHVTLEPSQHEDQSDYWVEAQLHPGDEATKFPLSIPGRWFGERLAYRPAAFPRLLFFECRWEG
jgi:hypothetical protein